MRSIRRKNRFGGLAHSGCWERMAEVAIDRSGANNPERLRGFVYVEEAASGTDWFSRGTKEGAYGNDATGRKKLIEGMAAEAGRRAAAQQPFSLEVHEASQVRRSMHQDCLLKPRNFVFYPFFYPFFPIFRPFSASGRQESRKHGQKSRGKREKIVENRGN